MSPIAMSRRAEIRPVMMYFVYTKWVCQSIDPSVGLSVGLPICLSVGQFVGPLGGYFQKLKFDLCYSNQDPNTQE